MRFTGSIEIINKGADGVFEYYVGNIFLYCSGILYVYTKASVRISRHQSSAVESNKVCNVLLNKGGILYVYCVVHISVAHYVRYRVIKGE